MFKTLRSAKKFVSGYVIPRVVIKVRGGYDIVTPATAKRRGKTILAASYNRW